MQKKSTPIKFFEATRLRYDELPVTRFFEPKSLYLLPLPDRVKACCEDKSEDIMEEEYGISTVLGGKQSFEKKSDWRKVHKKRIVYDQITKLTYGHFLCRNGTQYTFYVIYQEKSGREELQPTIRFSFEGKLTLEHFLQSLSVENASVHENLATYLYKIPDQEGYISVYRLYIRWLIGSDIFLPLAFQRVILDSCFNITPYDVIDYYDLNL